MTGPRRSTRSSPVVVGLAVVAAVLIAYEAARVVTNFPVSIDLVIPLQAAERWMAGDTVYVADGFRDPEAIPPFLYPPFVLPAIGILTTVPSDVARWLWLLALVAIAVLTCRRLAMPWWLIPFALAWPPFAEGIWNGNIQVVLFAAFVVTFWLTPRRHDLVIDPRDLTDPGATGPRIGFTAATVGAVKVSQALAWLVIARHQPRSAILGALPWALLVIATLPMTGIGLYQEWIGQAGLAADPAWPMIGVPLLLYLPRIVVIAVTVAAIVAALRLRGADAGAWVGLLMLVVAPNLHAFSGLFAIPAMLLVRREIALLAVIAMASYTAPGWWLGIGIVSGALLLSVRYPRLRTTPGDPGAVGSTPVQAI
jgi:hypothetical protein